MDARRSRVINAPPEDVWAVLEDPHHFPRWWPGVVRVEGVSDRGWTHVHTTKKGRSVRIDYRLLDSEPPNAGVGMGGRRSWEQEIQGTPFERVLNEAITEIVLEPADARGEGATLITIAQRQKLRGYSKTGGWMLRGATKKKLDDALDGLARIFG
jgi:uncharacterized protein YndB with AHSA1/START domain